MQIPGIYRQKAQEPMQQKPISDPAFSGPFERMRPSGSVSESRDLRFAEYMYPGSERTLPGSRNDPTSAQGRIAPETSATHGVSALERLDGSEGPTVEPGRDAPDLSTLGEDFRQLNADDQASLRVETGNPSAVSAQDGADRLEHLSGIPDLTRPAHALREIVGATSVFRSSAEPQIGATGGTSADSAQSGEDAWIDALPDGSTGAMAIDTQAPQISQSPPSSRVAPTDPTAMANANDVSEPSGSGTQDVNSSAGVSSSAESRADGSRKNRAPDDLFARDATADKGRVAGVVSGHVPGGPRSSPNSALEMLESQQRPVELSTAIGIESDGEPLRGGAREPSGVAAMASELGKAVPASSPIDDRRGVVGLRAASPESPADMSLSERPLASLQREEKLADGERETVRDRGAARSRIASNLSDVRNVRHQNPLPASPEGTASLADSLPRKKGDAVPGDAGKMGWSPEGIGAENRVDDVESGVIGQKPQDASRAREAAFGWKADLAPTPPAGHGKKTASTPGSTDGTSPGSDPGTGFVDMLESAFEVTEIREGVPREGAAQFICREGSGTAPSIVGRGGLRSVAELLAERAVVMRDGDLELRLSPKELGNLRISFSSGDANLMVTIQADRPETLDLFRRNIEQFTRDLAEMGYENVSMSFSENGDGGADFSREAHHSETARGADDIAPEDVIDVSRTGTSNAVSGLDLRL